MAQYNTFQAVVLTRPSSKDAIADTRRTLLKLPDDTFVDVMKLLATEDYCSPETLSELGRTPAMRGKMKKVGFIPSDSDESKYIRPYRPTRSREVLSKFGVELPKPPPRPLLRLVEIGARRVDCQEIRLDRAALFTRVWSEPVETLAGEWGLSGRGLAKACRRLKVPVPPRGFWAKKAVGKRTRRPELPQLPPGEAEEIVIWTGR